MREYLDNTVSLRRSSETFRLLPRRRPEFAVPMAAGKRHGILQGFRPMDMTSASYWLLSTSPVANVGSVRACELPFAFQRQSSSQVILVTSALPGREATAAANLAVTLASSRQHRSSSMPTFANPHRTSPQLASGKYAVESIWRVSSLVWCPPGSTIPTRRHSTGRSLPIRDLSPTTAWKHRRAAHQFSLLLSIRLCHGRHRTP